MTEASRDLQGNPGCSMIFLSHDVPHTRNNRRIVLRPILVQMVGQVSNKYGLANTKPLGVGKSHDKVQTIPEIFVENLWPHSSAVS